MSVKNKNESTKIDIAIYIGRTFLWWQKWELNKVSLYIYNLIRTLWIIKIFIWYELSWWALKERKTWCSQQIAQFCEKHVFFFFVNFLVSLSNVLLRCASRYLEFIFSILYILCVFDLIACPNQQLVWK